jgi:GST-like protein
MNPNGRIPVIVDDAAAGGPVTVFESGAILVYLAEAAGRLLPADGIGRVETLKWLFFGSSQVTHTAMQVHYLLRRKEAGEPHDNLGVYADELIRLYGILDRVLGDREFLAGSDYSIADIASWTWVDRHEAHGIDVTPWPHLRDWFARIEARPATQSGYDVPPRGDS